MRTSPQLLLSCLLLIGSHLALSGCGKKCSPGFGLVDDMCKRVVQDNNVAGAAATPGASSAGSGASAVATRTDPAVGAAGSSSRPSPSGDQDNVSRPGSGTNSSQGQPASGQAGNASGSADAGAAPSADDAMTSSGGEPAGPCTGRPGETVCEGTSLLKCDDSGGVLATEACLSEAFCQIGLAAGACAVCSPGSFQCDGARLDVCSDAGQYMVLEECATPELCKADAGLCTEMQCAPNAVTCSSDGATLNTCNADGSAFASQEDCEGKGCNSAQMTCNTCKPGEKTCSGTSLQTCNADGQTTSMMPCTATGECSAPSCDGGRCASERMPEGSSCSRGKCDSSGRCVACLAASDCPGGNACATPTCTAGVCRPQNARAGTECGTNMECDGSGRCEEKEPCMDNVFDPTMEECDPTSPEWRNSEGACDSNCRLTSNFYRACRTGGGSCWDGAPTGYFCSTVGACSRLCDTNRDCPTGGTCLTDPSRPGQRFCITTSCSASLGTERQWFGRQGCFEPSTDSTHPCYGAIKAESMCGWVSFDPTTRTLWCPNENTRNCCPPGGGSCVNRTSPM